MNLFQGKINKHLIFVSVAVVLFSMASPVLKLLVQEGGEFGLSHPMSISFCNVLFVGNLCAGLIVLFSFGFKRILRELIRTSTRGRLLLFLSSFLAFLYPTLIFFALESTSVTNIVLLSRFEGLFYVALAWIFFRRRLGTTELFGYGIIAIGVIVLALIGEMYMLGGGDLLVIIAALLYAISVYLSRACLKELSLGLFLFVRNFFSAFIFFWIAIYLYGFHHFAEAFVGELWILMAIYSLVVIVLGQYLWFNSGKKVRPERITHLTLISPFVSLLFAYILLGEKPTLFEGIGIGIILIGVIITKINIGHEEHAIISDRSMST
ncbi:MAG: DMT family transporter [Bacteroidia bacterium]|nr:DMT family transporter [Bacteroidia bacterium]